MSFKMFNNVLAYRMTDLSAIYKRSLGELSSAFEEKAAREPSVSEVSTVGFLPPISAADGYIEKVGQGSFVFSVMFAERLLPAKVIRREVAQRVAAIEREEQRKVYAREKNQIKDDVIVKFLPRAFVDVKKVFALIQGPYILIDTTSAKKGEEVLSLLRTALGSIGVKPVSVAVTPISRFTEWFIEGEAPEPFELTGDFKAHCLADEFDFVTGKGTSPKDEGLSDLVAEHDRRVTVLGLIHKNSRHDTKTSFTVNEMLGIKGIRWPEELVDMLTEQQGEDDDAVTSLRATLQLLDNELSDLLKDLLSVLGGEDLSEQDLANDATVLFRKHNLALLSSAEPAEEELI